MSLLFMPHRDIEIQIGTHGQDPLTRSQAFLIYGVLAVGNLIVAITVLLVIHWAHVLIHHAHHMRPI